MLNAALFKTLFKRFSDVIQTLSCIQRLLHQLCRAFLPFLFHKWVTDHLQPALHISALSSEVLNPKAGGDSVFSGHPFNFPFDFCFPAPGI